MALMFIFNDLLSECFVLFSYSVTSSSQSQAKIFLSHVHVHSIHSRSLLILFIFSFEERPVKNICIEPEAKLPSLGAGLWLMHVDKKTNIKK